MSKRFGRNQKRKLMQQLVESRADVQRFQHAYELSNELHQNASERLVEANGRLEMIYSDMVRNLNPRHPLLPERLRQAFQLSHADADFVRVPVPDNPLGGHMKVLEILRCRFTRERYRNLVAVKVTHGGKDVGYAVDLDSLNLQTFKEEMVRDLALNIANELLDELSKQGGTYD